MTLNAIPCGVSYCVSDRFAPACLRPLLCVLLTLFGPALAMSEAQQPSAAPATRQGTVLFNRNQNTAPDEKTGTPARQAEAAVSDAERDALTFAAYDLDVHLEPAASRLAVRARFTVRNTGAAPLARLVFQLSSSLRWESFSASGAGPILPLAFVEHIIDTDADHTGQAREAVVSLPQPLAPGGTVELAAFYSGEIVRSANRLERIGAPAAQAAQADWDRIAPEGTALRGFGDVLWYPVAAAPVLLGDGAKLFQAVGRSKQQQAMAMIHLRLTVEYVGDAPDAAYFCGRREPLNNVSENVDLPVANAPGVATAEFPSQRLGFRSPSLFVTDRAATPVEGGLIAAVTDHYDALANYAAAAAKVEPLLKDWLGPAPLGTLNLIDGYGQPFEDGTLLVAPVRVTDPDGLAPALMHSLTHAWFRSSHVWLDEGVPQLMSLLWTEQSGGRYKALSRLQGGVNALSLAEPASARVAAGLEPVTSLAGRVQSTLAKDHSVVGSARSLPSGEQSLVAATDEVYYRTKASTVLWMLRSIAGDDALKRALQASRYASKDDEDPRAFQHALEQSAKRNLQWFFDDWVYRDRGLPDLSIASVTPRPLPGKGDKAVSWLVAVEVRNDGDAAAEVPVTVRSDELTVTERLRVYGRSTASTRILFAGTPAEVLVNDGSVPEMTASRHNQKISIH